MKFQINSNVRNVAIIVVSALVLTAIPGGTTGTQVVLQAAGLVFLGLMVLVGARLYREHRVAIFSLGDTRRAILYSALGVLTFVLIAKHKLFQSGAATVAWIAIIGACIYTVAAVIWSAREY